MALSEVIQPNKVRLPWSLRGKVEVGPLQLVGQNALGLPYVQGQIRNRSSRPLHLKIVVRVLNEQRQPIFAGSPGILEVFDLDAQQRAAFDRYVGGIRNRTEQMRQDTDPLMSAAWEELAKPQPDMSRVERLFDEAAEKRRAIQHDTTSQTVELLAALSPAQRAKFVATMREWRAAWRQRAGSR